MHSGEISIPVLFCTLCCCLADSIANGAIGKSKMIAISGAGRLCQIPDVGFACGGKLEKQSQVSGHAAGRFFNLAQGSEDGDFNYG